MFVHLHVHSPFSFLDGASAIEDLVEAAASFDMPALAVTDHNNLSAAVRFHHIAIAAGITPIIGAEVTVGATADIAPPPSGERPGRGGDGGLMHPHPALSPTGRGFRGRADPRPVAPPGQIPKPPHHLTLLAQNSRGYANLCRILTHAHLSQPRLQPATLPEVMRDHSEGIIALSGCRRGEVPSLISQRRFAEAEEAAQRLRDVFGPDRFFLEMQHLLLPGEKDLNARLAELAAHLGVKLVTTNNVHHRRRDDFLIHDVLTCARTLTKLDDVHPERRLNAQTYFRSEREMREFFGDYPQALEAAGRIAEICEPALDPGEYRFPKYPVPEGETAYEMLERLAGQGARKRYGDIKGAVARRLRHELSVIRQLGFQDYFLAVWDLAQFARREGIRCAGRGSAADSLVAYCLSLTSVDPVARGLLFERFMSLERAAPPDIDLDFQAERRDDVTNYVIAKYGREHVGAVATYNTFRARSAVRDLGKAMGFPLDDLDHLSSRLPYLPADAIDAAFDAVPELRDSDIPRERYRELMEICKAVAGFPRHLSTHLGGIVITGAPIMDVSPLQMAAKGMPVMHFDKDDVEDLGLIKLDLLCLRMLSAVEDSVRAIGAREPGFDYEAIPYDDKESYDLVASTETVGLFQLESPAQRALHARLKPDRFEDLVASVAIIRPGPILANMVDPYLARRSGREPVTYLHPALERILSKTYGVVLFQEQVIEIATEIAGFTPGEADQLRRAMTHQRSWENMERIGEQFIRRARERGVTEQVAREIFSYIHAYAGYGFCEAHAAAFADTAYKTAYLMAHYPTEFYAALLSNQPMGFWPPNTLIWEAKRKGIDILGPDVNRSQAKFTVEEVGERPAVAPLVGAQHAVPLSRAARSDAAKSAHKAIRVGLIQIRGIGEASLTAILTARSDGPFRSLEDFCRRVRADRDLLRNMILCGAFDSLCPNRRQALWELDAALAAAEEEGAPPRLTECRDRSPDRPDGEPEWSPAPRSDGLRSAQTADFSAREKWHHEFDILDIAIREHPIGLIRERLRRQGVITAAQAKQSRSGRRVKVAGTIIRPHRPPTKSGRTVVFFTLEDETGLLDVTVFDSVYQRCGEAIFSQPIVTVAGRLDRRGDPSTPAALTADDVT
ncbi:MAG: DNA polymerase III subunit alpha [Armatimonadota bacterium]|nr:MAG: DNA polymerase III subunit alpha [Armatimonadota bacterium]